MRPTMSQEATQEPAAEGAGFEPDAEPARGLPMLPAQAGSKALALGTKPRASVAKPLRHWYILATARELRERPIARTLFGMPLVLFRDDKGTPGALLDRCPHRNVPLSEGSVEGGRLQCAYHGWQFDTGGVCRFVPSLSGPSEGKARRAPAFAAREEDGFIWVYATPNEEPKSDPYRFALTREKGYTTVRRMVEAQGTMHATLENALDVPHTAFLHRGLFRSTSRGITITAQVHRTGDRVVTEYLGEPRPPGIVARILSPSGGMVTHFDRFILPSIAQVEYRIGTENHFLVDSVMTPVSDFVTRIYAVVSFRIRLIPGWLLKPFLMPLALRVFQQDARILKMQTDLIHRFGGEQFVSTEIDVMGRHIWRLLKAAERGEAAGEEKGEVSLVV
jgi:phenylpropionate dioxygenase-like ring-hydroxylating dioxygenase large terminal subunit